MASEERINRTRALQVGFAGFVIVAIGVAISDGFQNAISGVLINAGVVVGLVAVVLYLERRITSGVATAAKEVAKAAAQSVVENETADLRERIERLEDVEAAQALARGERISRQEAQVEAVRENPTGASAAAVLRAALEERLLHDDFEIRGGRSADCPRLKVGLWEVPGNRFGLWLTADTNVELVFVEDRGFSWRGPQFEPERAVCWLPDQPASEAGERLEQHLLALGIPTSGFSFTEAVELLLKSIEVMRRARLAAASSEARLQDDLRLLINDKWVITSGNLEAVNAEFAFELVNPPVGRGIAFVDVDVEPPNSEAWREAVQWMQEREHMKLRLPGETEPEREAVLLDQSTIREAQELLDRERRTNLE